MSSPKNKEEYPILVFDSIQKSTPSSTGKKKFEFLIEDIQSNDSSSLSSPNNSNFESHLVFVGQVGPLDCSIGNIFHDDFRKTLAKLKEDEKKNTALSVLIVDDSIIQRKLSQRVLGGMINEVMWMVECAENGERAMQLVQTSPRRPDVIIIDQNMEPAGGRMLGHQVVELLRKDSAFDNVAIIGCTAMDEAKQDLLSAGCDAVWSKPMPSKTEAQAQIVQILRNKNSNFGLNQLEYDGQLDYPGLTFNHDIYERPQLNNNNNNNNNNNSNNNISNNNNNNGNGNNGNNNNDNNTIAIDDDFPVFRQVKMARISYKPNTSALSLPYSKYDVFGFNPPPPFPSIEITTPQPVFGPDPTPLDVTSMKHALAHISELPPDVSTLSPTASEINNNNNKTINLNINPTIVQDDSVNE